MAYTEIKEKGRRKYYYRVRSVRKGEKFGKERIYLGCNLNKVELKKSEKRADRELGLLENLLSKKELELLRSIKKRNSNQPAITYQNRYEYFVSLFTHDSTAIEGNTLTLRETARLLFDEMVPATKPLREINEVLNHKKAFDFILGYDGEITSRFIKELHGIIMKDILSVDYRSQVGKWRTVQVYIRGVDWTPPAPSKVTKDMRTLLSWYTKNRRKLHPVIVTAYFHVGFEIVHPFIDGNGRVGRLLLNFILHKNGYPMVNIPNKQKDHYYSVLEEAQINGDLRPFISFIIELLQDKRMIF